MSRRLSWRQFYFCLCLRRWEILVSLNNIDGTIISVSPLCTVGLQTERPLCSACQGVSPGSVEPIWLHRYKMMHPSAFSSVRSSDYIIWHVTLDTLCQTRSWYHLWRVRLISSSNHTPCRGDSLTILRYLINSENWWMKVNALHFRIPLT